MCPDFFPGCCSGGHSCSHSASILTCLYYAVVQNLVYGCGNVPQTTAESRDTSPTHVQQSVDMFIPFSRRPAMQSRSSSCSCSTGVRTVRWGMVVPYSECYKHCSPLKAPQLLPAVKTKDAKIGLLSADNRNKWNTNTTTPQYPHIIPWCQWTQSLRVLHFFRQCIMRHCEVDTKNTRA